MRLIPVLAACLLSTSLGAQEIPTIAEKTKGLERREGLLTHWLDRDRGKVWLELPAPQGDRGEMASFLYVEGITTGLGSNPVGLDRGQLGEAQLVVARRVGGRVLFEIPNLKFRALTSDSAEVHAVAQSFAPGILWGAEVTAQDQARVLVDFTSFLVRDAHGIVATLKRADQGDFSLDTNRSAVDFPNCLAFPDNLEFEALLTYSSNRPGGLVRATAALGDAPSFVQHHSLIRLPEPGYQPREFDPRAGSFAIAFADYAAPLAAPLERRWIVRHRLEKVDPRAARSPVKKPLVYYVDGGVPEPVRSALVEGASFWAAAFAAAGFDNAYRVEVLPPGVHPLDIRYNVIEWVHRSTRGWSYGGGVIDPRTGEMIKGQVSLGSLRIRQDRLIFEGLVGAQGTGRGGPNDPLQAALARIRQLAAHEVGHTLGFSHNYAASTYGDRASVMDYPAPRVGLTADGGLDLSDAYAVGPGIWDLHAVRYAYAQFPPGADERAELAKILREGLAAGLIFLTDADSRPPGAANAVTNLWDNGTDPIAELAHLAEVRRRALARFGPKNLGIGRASAELEEVLAPIYFFHRYQVEATVKLLGGLDFRYSFPGDGQPGAVPVAPERQRRALEGLLALLAPAELDLPEAVLASLVPRPAEYDRNVEMFAGRTAPAFDTLGAAGAAAALVVDGLLQPERAARVVDFHRRDGQQPSLDEVLRALTDRVFPATPPAAARQGELGRVVQAVVVRGLIQLAVDPRATPAVQARAEAALSRLASTLKGGADADERAHRAFLGREITRFLTRPATGGSALPAPLEMPPGSPIGSAPDWAGEGCDFVPTGTIR